MKTETKDKNKSKETPICKYGRTELCCKTRNSNGATQHRTSNDKHGKVQNSEESIFEPDRVSFHIKDPVAKKEFVRFMNAYGDDVAVIVLVTSNHIKKRIVLRESPAVIIPCVRVESRHEDLINRSILPSKAVAKIAIKTVGARHKKIGRQQSEIHFKSKKKEQTE